MTELQYYKAYNNALRNGTNITIEIMKKLKQTYIDAAAKAAVEVKKAIMSGAADITPQSWLNIQLQLEAGAREITSRLDDLLRDGLMTSSKHVTAIDEKYLIDIINQNNLDISKIGIRNLFVNVNNNVITNLLARIYADGYTFSERVWGVGLDYQNQIKHVISTGLAQGRDLVDIAADLNVYVQKDRRAVIKRWGKLKAGTKEFLRRIRKDIDYNALRLVRSELYASLQSTSVQNGQMNPGSTGWYKWIRQSTIDWGCDCPNHAANSPYALDDVPSYPHPNCFCIIQPLLRGRKEFVDDLSRWSKGESVDYLDKWNLNNFQYVMK